MTEKKDTFAQVVSLLIIVQIVVLFVAAIQGGVEILVGAVVQAVFLIWLLLYCMRGEVGKPFFLALCFGLMGESLGTTISVLLLYLYRTSVSGIQLLSLLMGLIKMVSITGLLSLPLLTCAGISAFPDFKKYASWTGKISVLNTVIWTVVFFVLFFIEKDINLMLVFNDAARSMLWIAMGIWLAKKTMEEAQPEEGEVYYAEGYDAESVAELEKNAKATAPVHEEKEEEPILPPEPVPEGNSDTVDHAMKAAEKIKEYRKMADEGQITEEEFRNLKNKILKF